MSNRSLTPPIALTCGDPAGIGPELAVKAREALGASLPFVWIGDPRHLPKGAQYQVISRADEAHFVPGVKLPVLALDFAKDAVAGQPDPDNAHDIIAAIERAVMLVATGEASALCTAPISKKVLKDGADFAYPGHTEFLAAMGGCERVVMMLACSELRVVPATIHIPLKDVPQSLTPELLEATIRITRAGLMRDFGIENPRLAIAGLNPHAGEGGVMGLEDEAIIRPLITKLAAEGMAITGPLPADTMFHKAARLRYDAAICAYHDQALIPIKTIDFDNGVNVTLGLPFVRTSPDHGTAFDIAGKGIASPSSLIAALKMAQEMARARAA